MSYYTLVNAQQMAIANPETFEVPTDEEIEAVKVNDHIKACFEIHPGTVSERMWCKVMQVEEGWFWCRVDNDALTDDLRAIAPYGATTRIHYNEVYQIYSHPAP